MLENGKSWSGRERNCAFLNTGATRFADVSAAMGLDAMYDSRGVAVCDWDDDGDLDLWMAHRTAPRVSLFQNNAQHPGRSLRLLLRGVKSNRDAIGARVEVFLAGESKARSIRTLRAGEGYLSQSAKLLHFGLPEGAVIERVEVLWPGGKRESFTGLKPGQKCRLVEGSGAAEPMPPRAAISLAASEPALPKLGAGARLIPHARLPMPSLPYQTLDGKTVRLSEGSGAVVVTLWATWCQSCLAELAEWKAAAAELRKAGLEVLCLNIDELAKPLAERRALIQPALAKLALPFTVGFASQDALDQFDVAQRALRSREEGLALPCAFVLDGQRRLVAFYRGGAGPTSLLADAAALAMPDADFRNVAIPFPGKWLMQSMPADLLAIPQKLLELERAGDAFEYLDRVVSQGQAVTAAPPLPSTSLTAEGVGDAYFQVAQRLALRDQMALSSRAMARAVQYMPSNIEARAAYGMQLERAGQPALAAAQYGAILALQPDHPAATNSLAWLLATSPDSTLRNPEKALALAESVVRRTEGKMAEPLDTLAAAYAGLGRFEEAGRAASQALALAQASGQKTMVGQIQSRLAKYQTRQPHVEGR